MILEPQVEAYMRIIVSSTGTELGSGSLSVAVHVSEGIQIVPREALVQARRPDSPFALYSIESLIDWQ